MRSRLAAIFSYIQSVKLSDQPQLGIKINHFEMQMQIHAYLRFILCSPSSRLSCIQKKLGNMNATRLQFWRSWFWWNPNICIILFRLETRPGRRLSLVNTKPILRSLNPTPIKNRFKTESYLGCINILSVFAQEPVVDQKGIFARSHSRPLLLSEFDWAWNTLVAPFQMYIYRIWYIFERISPSKRCWVHPAGKQEL